MPKKKLDISLDTQATILARYLSCEINPKSKVFELYRDALSGPGSTSENETRLISIAFRHPWLIPYLDSGLVFLRPYSELRRRIFAMFAILESTTENSDKFLAKRLGFFGVVRVVCVGIRDVLRTIAGIVIIKAGRL